MEDCEISGMQCVWSLFGIEFFCLFVFALSTENDKRSRIDRSISCKLEKSVNEKCRVDNHYISFLDRKVYNHVHVNWV